MRATGLLATALVMSSVLPGCGNDTATPGDATFDRASCDPALPGVTGSIALDAAVDPAAWSTLEIRFAPSSGVTDVADVQSHDSPSFPFEYSVGNRLGYTEESDWTLRAFLTDRAEPGDEPEAGEPSDATSFDFSPCSACGSACSGLETADLTLMPRTP